MKTSINSATPPKHLRLLPLGLSWQVWLALLTIWTIWGSTYLAIRIAVVAVPPYLLIGMRFLVAGGIMLVISLARKERWPTLLQWRNALVVGGLMLAGGVGSTALAEQTLSSSMTTVIVASGTLWNVLAAGVIMRDWPRRSEWLGITVGFVGIVLLSFDGNVQANWPSVLIQCFALICWAAGSALGRRLKLADGGMGNASEMLAGGAVLMLLSVLRRESIPIPAGIPINAWLAWGYLTVFGSVLAYTAYMYVLKHTRSALATSYSYINPIVAMILGYLILNERVSGIAFVAMGIVILGVLLMSRVKRNE